MPMSKNIPQQLHKRKKERHLASATLAEKTQTPPKKFLRWCFSVDNGFTKGSLREGAGAVGD